MQDGDPEVTEDALNIMTNILNLIQEKEQQLSARGAPQERWQKEGMPLSARGQIAHLLWEHRRIPLVYGNSSFTSEGYQIFYHKSMVLVVGKLEPVYQLAWDSNLIQSQISPVAEESD